MKSQLLLGKKLQWNQILLMSPYALYNINKIGRQVTLLYISLYNVVHT